MIILGVKKYSITIIILLLLSCIVNSDNENVSDTIDENTMRANEFSKPLFAKDTSKTDYIFKKNEIQKKD